MKRQAARCAIAVMEKQIDRYRKMEWEIKALEHKWREAFHRSEASEARRKINRNTGRRHKSKRIRNIPNCMMEADKITLNVNQLYEEFKKAEKIFQDKMNQMNMAMAKYPQLASKKQQKSQPKCFQYQPYNHPSLKPQQQLLLKSVESIEKSTEITTEKPAINQSDTGEKSKRT